MNAFRLRSYDLNPPGGYPYEQTEGIRKPFPSQPLIEAQAAIVADFRKGNGLPRSDVKQALEDVDHYQCFRLGNNPRWCVPVDGASILPLNTSSPIIAPCKGCGVVLS